MSSETKTTQTRCANCRKADSPTQCSLCHRTRYCNQTCQRKDWKRHKQLCTSFVPPFDPVEGVIIRCDKNRTSGPFEPVTVEPDHPIYNEGYVPPLFKTVGVDLILYRHQLPDSSNWDTGLDNQIATYLMVEEEDGLAAPQWQGQVGDVTVVRRNGKPLTVQEVETLWMYADHLMDLFGVDANIAQGQIERRSFDRFCRDYKEQQNFEDMKLPL